ncbi:MAG TPA: hypothetical protein VGX96_13415 [Candidatus Elarobacter sp.]|jgi:hypothetical protein|nr:hypothetical protein [Candidatus Elarobacter sp.]
MKSILGAQRPAFARKVLVIAVAAIFLVLAWAKAGFPTPEQPWFQMGNDGVLGMMPPTTMYKPSGGGSTPPSSTPTPQPAANNSLTIVKMTASRKTPPPLPDMSITQSDHIGHSYTYTAPAKGPVYLIKRGGTPWVTVTYNAQKGLYEVSDPNGTGAPVLKLGKNVAH